MTLRVGRARGGVILIAGKVDHLYTAVMMKAERGRCDSGLVYFYGVRISAVSIPSRHHTSIAAGERSAILIGGELMGIRMVGALTKPPIF